MNDLPRDINDIVSVENDTETNYKVVMWTPEGEGVTIINRLSDVSAEHIKSTIALVLLGWRDS